MEKSDITHAQVEQFAIEFATKAAMSKGSPKEAVAEYIKNFDVILREFHTQLTS